MLEKNEVEKIRCESKYFIFFVFATIILTWPIIVSPNKPISIRPDYFQNLWNFWWVKTSLFEQNILPYWTDYLYYPSGISLGRHTLSPVNSIAGGFLSTFLSLQASFNILLLLHFTLSAWAFFLLARYLSGNVPGSILAGLVYSYCPFHYYYMAQINIAALEFFPLVVLYFLKTFRYGGIKNTMLMALFMALVAASCSYLLAYAFIVAGLLVIGGKLWDWRVPFLLGMRRLVIGGMIGSVFVIIISLPLVLSIYEEVTTSSAGEQASYYEPIRANDLLGYLWGGPPEVLIVSWPTMLGYSTLFLLLLGYKGVVKQKFWLMVGGLFFILSMGTMLKVGGIDSGIPLIYKWLEELPIFSMLRKPDRNFLMIQFVVALLCAFSWKSISPGFKSRKRELCFWSICTIIIMLEITGIPFKRFDYRVPSYLSDLAGFSEVRSLIHLPSFPGPNIEGRYNYFQTFHEKKMPQGYVTSLALTDAHKKQTSQWCDAWTSLVSDNPQPILHELKKNDIDLVIVHNTIPKLRDPAPIHNTIVWAPFFMVRHDLVESRQLGPFDYVSVPKKAVEILREKMKLWFGAPVFEDSDIIVFKIP